MEDNIYDEVEIEDMTYDATLERYTAPCPCGDMFEISLADLRDGEDIAVCPSCSLMVRVIFDLVRPFHNENWFAAGGGGGRGGGRAEGRRSSGGAWGCDAARRMCGRRRRGMRRR